ncbi:hypothetical protein [Bradyrhizobium sp. OK095]|uniref:hypothetical protein n=1 Tax=Bradyrhizobium sp. OK095 TaxID=1882760 RepID=UPI0008C07B7D|nr:hypothetical protein [Bradyrhizobium sp. OK095]SEN66510.1 hypothetical protein SAMN05443254_11010 [Bradyrhizobium sp. OK095]
MIWDIMASDLVLSLLGLLLAAAAVVGWFPLLKYVPAIGAYVPVARLVAVLVLIAVSFLMGFRTSDERESMEKLRATLAAREADIAIAGKSATDAAMRANRIEADTDARHQDDAAYIEALEADSACAFDPFGGVRSRPGNAVNAAARPSAGSR